MKIERPRGTRDFPAQETEKRDHVRKEIEETFTRYGFRRIETPTFEHVELFSLKSGEEISTHMYVFEDKKDRKLCLRPEATASVSRMFSETLRSMQRPLKLYYFGPMFRYEEPQKGRYREFWQMGVELIGPNGAQSDAEVISMASDALTKLGLEFKLEIGHLGVLKGALAGLNLTEETQRKIIACIDKNDLDGLRALTSEKVILNLINLKGERNVIDDARKLLAGKDNAIGALDELNGILDLLDATGTKYVLNLGVARGLEYYTGMVFEIRVSGLGAQNQICGGGRYDGLIELFSGMSVPAVGFAYGFDRVVEAMESQGIETPKRKPDIVVAPVNEEVKKEAMKIAADLRKDFIVHYELMGRKLGKALEYASDIEAHFVVIVGKKELEAKMVTIKNMATGQQEQMLIDDIPKYLKEPLDSINKAEREKIDSLNRSTKPARTI